MAHPAYYVRGKRVPSVTTVLSRFKDPGALMHWSWECAYKPLEEACYVVEQVTQTHGGIAAIKNAKEFLKSDPLERAKFRKEAADAATAGTYAHGLVEQWIHGDAGERSNLQHLTARTFASRKKCKLEIATKAVKSFSGFLQWIKQTRFELSTTEESLVSNIWGYGGTLDCVGWINGPLILLDWKTSKRIYVDYLLQIAAYVILWNENYDPTIEEAHVILFHKITGDYQHFRFNKDQIDKAGKVFLKMLDIYRTVKEIEKEM